MWTYLLVYSPAVGTQEQVKRFIDSRKEITYWYTCIPNTFLIVSEETANTLKDVFLEFSKKRGRFLILDTKTDRNGWLPEKAWKIMRNPRDVPPDD